MEKKIYLPHGLHYQLALLSRPRLVCRTHLRLSLVSPLAALWR